jgi:hypothetical protein
MRPAIQCLIEDEDVGGKVSHHRDGSLETLPIESSAIEVGPVQGPQPFEDIEGDEP